MIRLIQLLTVIIFISSSIQDRRVTSFKEDDQLLNLSNGTMSICDNGFSLHTATVACRTLNKTSRHVDIVIDTSGKSQRGLILSRDWCGGTEKNLSECTRFREGSCMRGYVQILCKKDQKDVKRLWEKQKVVVKPEIVEGYVNDNVTLSCSVTPESRPESNRTLNWFRYEWRNDSPNKVIATSPSVTVTLKEDVTLTCNVYYRTFNLSQAQATLRAYYPPPAFQTHYVTVVVGTNLNFSRLNDINDTNDNNDNKDKPISNPAPSFELRKISRESILKSNTPSLKVKIEDGGTYILQMTNMMTVKGRERKGSGVMVVHLQVLERPKDCTKHYFARLNTNVTLQCAKTNWTGDLKVNWTRGDGDEVPFGKMTKIIDSVSDEEVGNHSCVFTYHKITIGEKREKLGNQTSYTCNMTLHVLEPSYNFTVWEGGNTTLKNFQLDSNSGQEWHKLVGGVMNETNETLKFPKVTRNQAGIYINSMSMNESLELMVMYEPKITCATRKSVERGTTLTLPCGDLHTYPGVERNITWRRAESSNVTSTEFFVRDDVTDDDEGVYVCNVSIIMTDGWNDTKNFSIGCEIEVVVYESNDLTLTLAVVSGVFSVCVLVLTGAVVFLACRLFGRPKDNSSSDTGIALTTKPTTNNTKTEEKEPRRKLPNAPNMPLPNSPADLQQDVYENA